MYHEKSRLWSTFFVASARCAKSQACSMIALGANRPVIDICQIRWARLENRYARSSTLAFGIGGAC